MTKDELDFYRTRKAAAKQVTPRAFMLASSALNITCPDSAVSILEDGCHDEAAELVRWLVGWTHDQPVAESPE